MPASSDDEVGEYLDDPISLVAFENIKTEKCDSDTEQIIDLGDSTDEESLCASSYGKKNFVLPVTFFDISRNVRLLNKCIPMCIKIVDCKQYPSYYNKHIPKIYRNQGEDNIPEICRNPSEDSGVEVFNKSENNSENEPRNANMEYTVNSPIKLKENAEKTQDKGKNKRRPPLGHSFYEKLKKRKEHRKENALKSKDLSQVDFKRNKGLVGLKITKCIFEKIVDTEKALSEAKNNNGENSFKDKSGSERENVLHGTKTNLTKSTFEKENDTNKTLITTNSDLAGDKCKGQPKSDKGMVSIVPNRNLSCTGDGYIEKTESNLMITVIEQNNKSATDKCKENFKTDTEKTDYGTINNISDSKHKEKTKINTIKTNGGTHKTHKQNNEINKKTTIIETSGKILDKDETSTEKSSDIRPNIYLAENICREEGENNIKKTTTEIKNVSNKDTCNLNTKLDTLNINYVKDKHRGGETCTNITFPDTTSNSDFKKSKEKSYITKNTTHTQADCINGKKHKKTDTRSANNMDSSENLNENNKMRCSLKIPSKKIIEKALKLKQSINNEIPPDMPNLDLERHPRQTMKKGDQANLKFCLKSNDQNVESANLVSNKNKKPCKSQKNTSAETKHVIKSTVEDTNVDDKVGSNSPVIPCTTISFRAPQSKLSSDTSIVKNHGQNLNQNTAKLSTLSTSHQNNFQIDEILDSINIETNLFRFPPKDFSVNQAGLTKDHNNYVTSQKSHSRSTIAANVNKKSCAVPNQNSSTNYSHKVVERKYPHIFVRMGDSKSNVSEPTVAKPVSDLSHTNQINSANILIPMTKSASTGNASSVNNYINGVIKNQTNLNKRVTSLPYIRPLHPSYSGSNAIIIRRPPPPRDFQKKVSPIRGQPIQTVINHRFQNQTFPVGGTPMRFQVPPRYLPPNTNIPSNVSPAWPSNQHFVSQSGIPRATYMRCEEFGLWQSRFPEYPFPIDLRPPPPPPKPVLPPTTTTTSSQKTVPPAAPKPPPPLPPPPPPPPPSVDDPKMPSPPRNILKKNLRPASVPEVSTNSVIGSTADGELIKKINIVAMPAKMVSDKEMMLAELNSAVMSPELAINEPEDRSKEIVLMKPGDDSKLAETVKPKYSKPCPLSKKINVDNNENPEKLSQNIGYSPPILPILTYEEILTQSDKYKSAVLKGDARTASNKRVHNTAQKRKLSQAGSGKQYQAKKISFADYRHRASKDDTDRIDASKFRKGNIVADDYNQDQGYDSDSTVKL